MDYRKKIAEAGCLVVFCAAVAGGSAVEDNSRGVASMNAGRFDEAIHYFSVALQEEPANGTIKSNLMVAYSNAAMAYEKKGDFDNAYSYMKKAYSLDPGSDQIKKNFAYILTSESYRRYNNKNGQDAVPLLKESLEYDDSRADTHSLLGQLSYDNDEYTEARQHWEKALCLDPSRAVLLRQLDKLGKEMTNDDRLDSAGKSHFKVRYEGVELWTASREVLDMLEDAWNNAGWKLGEFPREPVTVIIYTQQEFQTISGKSDWFAGAYDGKIRLRRSDVEGDKQRLRQIIYHEYMHAFVHYVAGNNVPTWFNEGIAQCYENMPAKAQLSFPEKNILKDRINYGMPRLDQVDQMFVSTISQADVNFAYIYSKAFVAYLIEKGFDINIKSLLDELAAGSTLNDAFEKVYCRNIEQMLSEWLRDL
jgi:tetratricopeptide (TPR) repeat protein